MNDENVLELFEILKIDENSYETCKSMKNNLWDIIKISPLNILSNQYHLSDEIIDQMSNISKIILILLNISNNSIKQRIIKKVLKKIGYPRKTINNEC